MPEMITPLDDFRESVEQILEQYTRQNLAKFQEMMPAEIRGCLFTFLRSEKKPSWPELPRNITHNAYTPAHKVVHEVLTKKTSSIVNQIRAGTAVKLNEGQCVQKPVTHNTLAFNEPVSREGPLDALKRVNTSLLMLSQCVTTKK